MKRKLNQRVRKAIKFYLEGHTQVEAMKKAGFSKSYSETRYYDVFGHKDVKEEIERRQALAAKRNDIDLDWAINILRDIAEGDLIDLYKVYSDGSLELDLSKLEKFPQLKRIISGLEVETYVEGRGPNSVPVKRVKVRTADRLRAIELLIRHLGLSKEKVNVEGEIALVDRINQGLKRVGRDEDS